jgi:hypothetical protein
MVELLKLIASIMKMCHDWIVNLVSSLGFCVNDKALHFLVIGIIGMMIFACVNALFKYLSNRSANVIAFVCTFVIVVILAVTIEILQGMTNSGNMEFADITYGVFGFISCFFVKRILDVTQRVLAEIKEHKKSYDCIRPESVV